MRRSGVGGDVGFLGMDGELSIIKIGVKESSGVFCRQQLSQDRNSTSLIKYQVMRGVWRELAIRGCSIRYCHSLKVEGTSQMTRRCAVEVCIHGSNGIDGELE